MAKEIERAGIPVIHCCSIVPISMTVGANRILPTIAIPHPFGEPDKSREEEKIIRKSLVKKALEAFSINIEGQTLFEPDDQA